MSFLKNFNTFFKNNYNQLYLINKSVVNILIISLFLLNIYDISYHFFWENHLSFHQYIEFILLMLIILVMIILKMVLNIYNQLLSKEILQKNRKITFYKEKYRKIISEIHQEIENQFDKWNFTKEEKRIAKYLILGFSFKEIAGLLNKSEKTVRNQSLEIYQKSGMVSRNDLAGFFLSDFLKLDEDNI